MAIVKTPFLIDTFTGASGTTLQTHLPDLNPNDGWTKDAGGTLNFKINGSNQLTRDLSPAIPPGPGTQINYHALYAGTLGSKWQYVSFTIPIAFPYPNTTFYLCYKPTAPTYVVSFLFNGPVQIAVREIDNGVTLLNTGSAATFNPGDTIECRVADNGSFGVAEVYQNGNLIYSGALQATGNPGSRMAISNTDDKATAFILDNIEVGTLTDQINNWTNTLSLSGSTTLQTRPSIKLSDGSILIGKNSGTIGVYTPFIYRSTDNGDTWTAVLQQSNGLSASPPTSSNYRFNTSNFLEVGGGVVIANGSAQGTVAGSGAIKTTECYSVWRSTDYGATWTPIVGIRGLSDAWGSIIANDSSIVITGTNDREAIYGTSAYANIMRSVDGGLTFTPTLTGALNDYTQSTSTGTTQYIWKTNTGRLLTSKSDSIFDNIIVKSDDNGVTWSVAQNLGAVDTYNILSTTTPLFLCNTNELMQSVDNGSTWTTYASQPTSIGDLFYSNGTLFVVSGMIERSTGGAFTTVYNNAGVNVTGMTKVGTDWYAYGGHYAVPVLIMLSTDDGLTWNVDQTDAVITHYNFVTNIIALSSTRLLATGGGFGGAGTFSNKLAWTKNVTPSVTGGSDILRSAIFYNQLLRNRIVR